MNDRNRYQRTLVGDLVAQIEARELPLIGESAELEELVEAMGRFRHSRLLYVVDPEERLLGTISLGVLARHCCAPSHEAKVHPRILMHMITAENAGDMMLTNPVVTDASEEVGLLLKRMIRGNIKEVPVLDEEGRVVADLTIVDLMAYLMPFREDNDAEEDED